MRPATAIKTAAGTALLGLVIGLPGTAMAAPQSPAQQAATLRAQVDALSLQAEQATEAYDTAESQLGDLVSQAITARQQASTDAAQAGTVQNTQQNRVRALYMTGGPAGLLSSVLDGESINDAASRLHNVQTVIGADSIRTQDSRQKSDQAAANAATLQQLAERQTALQTQVATQAQTIRTALARRQQLLARANAQVKALAAQQRAAAAARAAAAFQAQLAAARATAGAAGSNVSLPSSTTAPTAQAAAAIAAARTRLGDPYVWGATGPDTFDCSGLTGWAYRQAGVSLPRTSREQWNSGPHPAMADLAPGDLLFWASDTSNPGSIHHVALYIGGGQMIAAPTTGDVVKIQAVYLDGYIGAVRPVS